MRNDKIEIDFGELKRQVASLMAELRSEERPEHRIAKIVGEMRRFKAEVVKANTPRDYERNSDPVRLRQHRDRYRTHESDLTRLREWLKTRDGSYLVGPAGAWRLDDAEWERDIWSTLYAWVERGYALLFEPSGTEAWPRSIPSQTMTAWEAEERDLEWRLMGRIADFVPVGSPLTLDPTEHFTVRWRGVPCFLGGGDGYKIMERLAAAKGRKVSVSTIGLAIGDGEYSGDALRQAVSRLKRKLKKTGLDDLAAQIKTAERGGYVYLDSTAVAASDEHE